MYEVRMKLLSALNAVPDASSQHLSAAFLLQWRCKWK